MRPSMSAHPQVGSVMRERIFRSVLFPAPFLPISPTTSPARISNDDVPQRPHDRLVGLFRRLACQQLSGALDRRGGKVDHALAKRLLPYAEVVSLPQTLSADHHIIHVDFLGTKFIVFSVRPPQTMSANVRSIRRK